VVGIVLVSHSHSIAEGAAELARQMGGEDVRIETAGGLDTPDEAIGTDAALVVQAIERAWSEDGVLVLMDLGSAVLSAEMALDLLPDGYRDKVVLTDAPFVEGAVAGAVTARIGAPLERVAAEARSGLAAKAAHLGVETAGPSTGAVPATGDDAGGSATTEFVVRTVHGLHARPAALLVRAASAFDADVRVTNLETGGGPVSARSLNAVATLGVTKGQRVEVSASGPQAREAIHALSELAERNFDEGEEDEAPAAKRADAGSGGAVAELGRTMTGLPASPGVAVGHVRRFHAQPLEIRDEARGRGVEAELGALDDALSATRRDIEQQRSTVAGRAGSYRAAIFDAHLLLLDDEAILGPARDAIASGASAASAWDDSIETTESQWRSIDDEYQRARAADVRSVGTQVLARLLGVDVPKPRLDAPGVLVAPDLAPADAAALDRSTALGVATAFGGPTSHAAVLARALGIPAVVGLGADVLDVAEDTNVALDGDTGVLVLDPEPDIVSDIEARRAVREHADRVARAAAGAPATTRDGTAIEVAANVGSLNDLAPALDAGADGVGLFRTEFLFMQRDEAPTEDEQVAAYRAAAEAMQGRPMLVRTLDAGADKPLPYLGEPEEPNPFLGVRGLRLGLMRPDVLDVQLRALVRVAADHPVRVMFPMVATVDELRAARAALDRASAAVAEAGRRIPQRLQVGAMIEVPSAGLAADRLAPEVDFFSLGTNDLSQYVLAADRGNERVASLADALHPAVLELIRRTAQAAATAGIWTGLCGELAGDALATPLLVGLGVRELSMSAPAIPHVKQAVRNTELAAARDLAEEALTLSSAEEVRELLRKHAAV
jgi:multiphosphoryl transfer protein